MTQQHYKEREKHKTEGLNPPHVYSSSFMFHILLQKLISYLIVSFCSMAFLSLFFQGQLLIIAGEKQKCNRCYYLLRTGLSASPFNSF